MSAVQGVTDADFEQVVLRADGPALVEFWAEWCVPCRMFARILEEVAGELQGRIAVWAVNIDESPATTATYGISGVPAMALFNNGELIKTMTGARPRAALLEDLSDVVEV